MWSSYLLDLAVRNGPRKVEFLAVFVGSYLVSNVSRHERFTHRTYQQPHGGERDEVILSLDEVVAWLEAGLLDPREGETEELFHVGRWRRQKGPDEPQAEGEEEMINEDKPQKDDMPTAISRVGAWQRVVPLLQRQPGAYSAQVVEALEANEVSDDDLETEYQEVMAVPTVVKSAKQGNLRALDSTSSGGNFCVYNRDRWAIGETVTIAWPK